MSDVGGQLSDFDHANALPFQSSTDRVPYPFRIRKETRKTKVINTVEMRNTLDPRNPNRNPPRIKPMILAMAPTLLATPDV